MKVVLYDNKQSLPEELGDHIFIYTGLSDPVDGEATVFVTEIHCTYSVGGQTVFFKKNTEPQALRFEDAVIWAVSYAKTVNITTVYAVFQAIRLIDIRLLSQIGGARLVDERKTPQFGGGVSVQAPNAIGPPSSAARSFLPKTPLQRRSIGAVKRSGNAGIRRRYGARSGL